MFCAFVNHIHECVHISVYLNWHSCPLYYYWDCTCSHLFQVCVEFRHSKIHSLMTHTHKYLHVTLAIICALPVRDFAFLSSSRTDLAAVYILWVFQWCVCVCVCACVPPCWCNLQLTITYCKRECLWIHVYLSQPWSSWHGDRCVLVIPVGHACWVCM